MTEVDLIGDIGATTARLAVVGSDGTTSPARLYVLSDYPSLADVIETYLADTGEGPSLGQAVLAVASPIIGDRVTLTNHDWSFSIGDLRRHLGLTRLRVINDFAANAMAVPHLGPADRVQVGGGAPVADAAVGVIGPGTGLGVSALVPAVPGALTISGEGGHATMAPANAQESAVLDLMRTRFGHVSAERVLSGPGLVNLYGALCELAGVPAAAYQPPQITSERIWREDSRTREATEMFCAMLGTVAGNLALTLGARGGIYLAGGIVPRLLEFLARSEFRGRFEAKGRFQPYLAAIPTYVITRPLPALLGAAALLRHN